MDPQSSQKLTSYIDQLLALLDVLNETVLNSSHQVDEAGVERTTAPTETKHLAFGLKVPFLDIEFGINKPKPAPEPTPQPAPQIAPQPVVYAQGNWVYNPVTNQQEWVPAGQQAPQQQYAQGNWVFNPATNQQEWVPAGQQAPQQQYAQGNWVFNPVTNQQEWVPAGQSPRPTRTVNPLGPESDSEDSHPTIENGTNEIYKTLEDMNSCVRDILSKFLS